MNREQARELHNEMYNALEDALMNCDEATASLVAAKYQRGMSRWNLFTLHFWPALDWFTWHNPQTLPIMLRELKTAFFLLIFKHKTKW